MKLKIQEVAYHRNGIDGRGFYAVRFRWTPDNRTKEENFLGIVFNDAGACTVIGLDRIESQGVKFAGGNSWQGDHFEAELRQAIKDNELSSDERVGPFCVPK
jgi:hypothetical protein